MTDNINVPQRTDSDDPLMHRVDDARPTIDRWQQLKTEGVLRLRRIGKIFQAAFSEAKTELRSGSETMRPLAQELSSTVAKDLKETSKTTATEINKTWKDSPDTATVLRSLLLSFAEATKARLLPWYKAEAKTIDAALSRSYGNRYGSAKRGFKVAKARYDQATAPMRVSADEKAVAADGEMDKTKRSITQQDLSGED